MFTIVLPKFDAVRTFKSNVALSNKPGQMQLQEDLKNAGNKQTQDYQHEVIQKYQTRSTKILCDPLDISFEQNFMEEHKLSFKKESEKYIEFQQKLLEIISKISQFKKVLHEEVNLNGEVQIEKILRNSSQILLNAEQVDRFVIDLRRQDKLHDFIESVIPKLEQEVKIELIYIAHELWEEYILIQEFNFNLEQTLEFAQNVTKKSIQKLDQKLNYINFKYFHVEAQNSQETGAKGERFKHFKNFVLYLNTTFSLVIAGFFENPYFKQESNYFKRDHKEGAFNFGSLNDDNNKDYDEDEDNDEEEDYYKKKKVKY